MKKLILILLVFIAYYSKAQEVTIETLDIVARDVTEIICEGDTINRIYSQVIKTTTENGTDFPDTRIDTILYKNGNCPADSLEVLRQIEGQAIQIENKAWSAMNRAFQNTKRGHSNFLDVRTLYNDFTGSDLYYSLEDRFANAFEADTSRWRIVDVQDNSNVTAILIRVGGNDRYRLEIEPGEVGAGTRFPILPFTNGRSLQINNWPSATLPADNYRLYRDDGVDSRNPVYRMEGFIDGGDRDIIRLIKLPN